MFHFQAEAPYMGGCGCGYVQAAPYVEYAPPYPVLMGRHCAAVTWYCGIERTVEPIYYINGIISH